VSWSTSNKDCGATDDDDDDEGLNVRDLISLVLQETSKSNISAVSKPLKLSVTSE
jgi:hypothetical protein